MEYQEPKLMDPEDEEEEEEVGLQGRRTGHRSSNNGCTAVDALISDNGHGNGNGSVSEHVIETKFDSSIKRGGEVQVEDKSVYFDQILGIWKCHHCEWTYGGQCPWTVHGQTLKEHSHTPMNIKNLNQQGPIVIFETKGPKSTDGVPSTEFTDVKHSAFRKNTNDGTADDFEIQENRTKETNHQNGQNLAVDILSGPSPSPIVEQFKERDIGFTPLISETGVVADVDFTEEIDQEGDDYDIERVIEKQNTHDLYCPNCHSCITRKVILRRRKLKIRGRKPKRDATQTIFHSELGANTAPPVDDQEHGIIDISSNGGTVPAASDNDHVQQRDIFRCLSCFSIFIPTGNGFKLFRCFGNNNETENVTEQQKAPSASTNWFYSIFASGKDPVNITQIDITTECNSSLLPSHGNDFPVSLISDGNLVNKGEVAEEVPNKPPDDRQAFLSSSAVQSVQCEKTPTEIGQEQEANSAKGKEIFASQNAVAASGTATVKVSVSNTTQQLYPRSITDNMRPQKEKGESVILDVETGPSQPEASLTTIVSVESEILPQIATQVYTSKQGVVKSRNGRQWEILKSIVYGGLVESITSLVVVSSAAAASSATLNILVLGLANLIGGLPIIFHNLRELKKEPPREASGERNEQEDRYQELLGRRENFALHATLAILSFIIFGLLPPVIYGFSFGKSDNRDYKLAAVGVAGLVCIALLAIAKVYVQKPPKSYIKTVTYYLSIGIASSGAAYLAGELIGKVLEKLEPSAAVLDAPLVKMRPTELPLASY
ncbi:membrane protein of ER body-like protein isoform X2 [Tripterygium wilfordii]|uniref:membrane protein of ER body-like protein isoform X2 n=1 Tax=Tripterygium wilfordii TaxID=458696 RepID=UPI0018F7EC5B|nr:membrane protein of ER body-like protein isoform X2 [Tripterygium wilfordii]